MATLGTAKAVVGGLSLVAVLFISLNVSHPRVRQSRFKQVPRVGLPHVVASPKHASHTHVLQPAAIRPDEGLPQLVASPKHAPHATNMAQVTASPPVDVCENASTYLEHTEFWGGLVMAGDQNVVSSAAECCRTCRDYEPTIEVQDGKPCTTFVYHPTTRACWLKNTKQEHLDQPGRGPSIPWTSGVLLGPHKPCEDCVLPSFYTGCVSKTLCNTSRECGSPAIDGYSLVDPKCLEASREAQRYLELLRQGVALERYAEEGADFDGLGVRWGIGHKKANWSSCEAACITHRPTGSGPFGKLPCNVWTWCGKPKCWEPDAHSHSFGDCWLKFSELPEAPEVNMRAPMSKPYMRRHGREMAEGVPWVSGVLLAPGLRMSNGTWGPRSFW